MDEIGWQYNSIRKKDSLRKQGPGISPTLAMPKLITCQVIVKAVPQPIGIREWQPFHKQDNLL